MTVGRRCRSLGRQTQRMNGSGPGVVHQLTGVVVMATNQPGSNAPPLQNSYLYSSLTPSVPSTNPSWPLPPLHRYPPLFSRSIALGFCTLNSFPWFIPRGVVTTSRVLGWDRGDRSAMFCCKFSRELVRKSFGIDSDFCGGAPSVGLNFFDANVWGT